MFSWLGQTLEGLVVRAKLPAQMLNIHLRGTYDKPNGNHLIFDIGGTLSKNLCS